METQFKVGSIVRILNYPGLCPIKATDDIGKVYEIFPDNSMNITIKQKGLFYKLAFKPEHLELLLE